MDAPNAKPRSICRFSLRELMLVMLAAAAFIGWATLQYRSSWLKPTQFFASHESWQQDVAAVLQELDEPPFQGAGGTMMHGAGPVSVQRTMVFRIPLPTEKQHAFATALNRRMQAKLKDAGCKLAGGSSGLGASDVNVIGYTQEPVAGTVQICVGDLGSGRASIVVTMHEQRAAYQDFGIENAGR
jgi:hypothetical protein